MFFYLVGSKSSSQKYEINVERIIESDVAKPFSMLSAYLMTAAITSPPSACGKLKKNKNLFILLHINVLQENISSCSLLMMKQLSILTCKLFYCKVFKLT